MSNILIFLLLFINNPEDCLNIHKIGNSIEGYTIIGDDEYRILKGEVYSISKYTNIDGYKILRYNPNYGNLEYCYVWEVIGKQPKYPFIVFVNHFTLGTTFHTYNQAKNIYNQIFPIQTKNRKE